jgi:hypothetical protein
MIFLNMTQREKKSGISDNSSAEKSQAPDEDIPIAGASAGVLEVLKRFFYSVKSANEELQSAIEDITKNGVEKIKVMEQRREKDVKKNA